MRILAILTVLLLLSCLGLAIFMRFVPMSAERWHIDPSSAIPPNSPNFVLLAGQDAVLRDGEAGMIAEQIDARARALGMQMIAGSTDSGFMTYVTRSRLFGFPDAISIKITPEAAQTGEARSRIEIFSRSRFGYDDLGANQAHITKLLAAVTA